MHDAASGRDQLGSRAAWGRVGPQHDACYLLRVQPGASRARRPIPFRETVTPWPARFGWVLVTLLFCLLAWAGTRMTVRDGSGTAIGQIDDGGVVRNRSGSAIGRIEVPGAVRDRSGSSVGRVDANGVIRDSSGSAIGRVDDNGTLRDRSGSSIGRLDGCAVRNRSGSATGRFDDCGAGDRLTMAAYLFFFEPLHER
jgi:hypothetical protein